MLYLTKDTQILLATKPVDFRKQIDGLIAFCEQTFIQDCRSGKLFVFINQKRTMVRVLCYEDNGYWLATKRLSKGRYSLWPSDKINSCQKTLASDLMRILKTFVLIQEY